MPLYALTLCYLLFIYEGSNVNHFICIDFVLFTIFFHPGYTNMKKNLIVVLIPCTLSIY